jgi:hypothetical protein
MTVGAWTARLLHPWRVANDALKLMRESSVHPRRVANVSALEKEHHCTVLCCVRSSSGVAGVLIRGARFRARAEAVVALPVETAVEVLTLR